MITIETLKRTPAFTVLNGSVNGEFVANAKKLEHAHTYWVISPVIDDPPDEIMRDQVQVEGYKLLVTELNDPMEPRIVEDNLDDDGVGHLVSDWDAVLWALNDGFNLIKVPDELDDSHYHWLVLGECKSKSS